MTRRQTIIVFKAPTDRLSTDVLHVEAISRRGHVDPATMRDLAVRKGATGEAELTVTWHETTRDLRSFHVAKFIVNIDGPAKPIRLSA